MCQSYISLTFPLYTKFSFFCKELIQYTKKYKASVQVEINAIILVYYYLIFHFTAYKFSTTQVEWNPNE